TFSYPNTGSAGGATAATCWLKHQVTSSVENNCCVSGERRGARREPSRTARDLDRSLRRRLQKLRHADQSERRGLQEGLRGGQPLPRVYLRAVGVCRHRGALLSQGQDHAAAAKAVLRVRRGAVAGPQPVPPTVMRSMRSVGWPTPTG